MIRAPAPPDRRDVLAVVGSVVGTVVDLLRDRSCRTSDSTRFPFLAERAPLPHHVPEHAGGVALRFAMVQDVLTERFARHGAGLLSRPAVAARRGPAGHSSPPPTPPGSPSLMTSGSTRERLGQSDAAIATLRGKLDAQT